jgi:hypothetical protein
MAETSKGKSTEDISPHRFHTVEIGDPEDFSKSPLKRAALS